MATTINTHYSLTPTSDSEKKILLYNDKYVLTRERNWANIQEGGGDYTNIDNLLFFKVRSHKISLHTTEQQLLFMHLKKILIKDNQG